MVKITSIIGQALWYIFILIFIGLQPQNNIISFLSLLILVTILNIPTLGITAAP